MVLFSFIAGVLVGVAASFIGIPLWRSALTLGRGRMRYVLPASFVAGFALVAGIIYLVIGSRHSLESSTIASAGSAVTAASGSESSGAGGAKSMQAAVAGLEARLARGGGTAADWSLLARAYEVLGRADDAARARARAGDPAAAPAAGPAAWQMSAAALTTAAAAADKGTDTPAAAATTVTAAAGSMAADLERRLAQNPRDAQGWLALADLRRSQRDYAGARTAYLKLVDLRAMSAQSWADYADVLGSLAGGSLGDEAGRAIDNALALDAANPKALWLKASQAHEQRRYAEALGWWKKLRAVVPPDSADARMIDANIAEASSLAGQSAATSGAAATLPRSTAASAAGAEVTGTVTLDTRLANRVQPDSTLFIYAKAADSPGPPLAVMRTSTNNWPVQFRLDDSMAMIPSRRLSQFDRIVIEARISRSGQATPATGDLYVTSPVLRPVAGTRLALVINREIG